VDAATDTFLKGRTVRLEADRKRELERLGDTGMTLAAAISTLSAEVKGAKSKDSKVDSPTAVLPRDHRNELLPQAAIVARQSARIAGLALSGGQRVAGTSVTQSADRLRVDLVSGLTAGLALGAMLVITLGAAGARLKRVKDVETRTGLPLLARTSATPESARALAGLFADRPMSYVAATESDREASTMAARLTETTHRPRHRAGAVVVASGRTRVEQVLACQGRLSLQGIPVRGVVLTTGVRPRRWWLSPVRAFRLRAGGRPAILGDASRRRQGRVKR
jgi:hypothetical protein